LLGRTKRPMFLIQPVAISEIEENLSCYCMRLRLDMLHA
jgi:hypothetical protein